MLKNGYFLGKNILVTGGGSGLGQAIALGFSRLGGNVLICGRDEKKLDVTMKMGKNIEGEVVDVKRIEEVKELYKNLSGRRRLPDILINNAAANFLCPSHKLTYNGYKSIIETNLIGTMNMTLEAMRVKGGDMVVGSITTTYAETGSKGVLPSAVSKAGINSMIRTLSSEWGRYNVRTFGVAPGAIYTDGAFSRLDPTGKGRDILEKRNPMGRMGSKEELVDLVMYLSSDYAGWINGEIVRMDGGELNENSGMFNFAFSQLNKL
jgi:2,4-dienoyl-CoA reductase